MKFSIIIPVYNVEKYLDRCVESILEQTYKKYELILVNDGSKDNSLEKCNYYKKYDFVSVIDKKNGGASSARNEGIKHCNGDYIMFIDGDDFLYKKDTLEKLNNNLKKNNYDIIQYKMINYYEKIDKFVFNNDIDIDNNLDFINKLDELNKKGSFSVSPCNKVIKASLIKDNSVYFEEGKVAEDIDWNLSLYQYTNSLLYLNEDIYAYRRERLGSVSTSKNSKKSKDLLFFINKWYEKKDVDEKLRNIYLNFLSYEFLILRLISNKKDYTDKELEIIKTLENNIYNFDDNYKVKIFNKLRKFLGFNLSYKILKIYMFLKSKGLIK